MQFLIDHREYVYILRDAINAYQSRLDDPASYIREGARVASAANSGLQFNNLADFNTRVKKYTEWASLRKTGVILEEIIFRLEAKNRRYVYQEPDIRIDGVSVGSSKMDVAVVNEQGSITWKASAMDAVFAECKFDINGYLGRHRLNDDAKTKIAYAAKLRQAIYSSKVRVRWYSFMPISDGSQQLLQTGFAGNFEVVAPVDLFERWIEAPL